MFLLLLFSNQTGLKSVLSFCTGKVVLMGRQSRAHYFSLSYLANMIKCFLRAITTIITLKCNIILCITGNWRRKLLETIRPQLENTITKAIFDFLQISLKASCSLKLSGEGHNLVDVCSSSNTERLFVFRMSNLFVASSQGPDKGPDVTLGSQYFPST